MKSVVLIAAGDVHGDYDALERIAEAEREALVLLQIGDLIEPPADRQAMSVLHRLPLALVWIQGNNEDWAVLEDGEAGPGRRLLPGQVWQSGTLRVAGVGGTHAPTWYARDKPFPGERRRHYNYEEIEATLALGQGTIDILMTHEAPHGLARGAGGRDPGQAPLDRLVRELRPRVLLSGHHHRWRQAELGVTTAFSLPPAGEGYVRLRWDVAAQPAALLGWEHVVLGPVV